MSGQDIWARIIDRLEREGYFSYEIDQLIDAVESGDHAMPERGDWNEREWVMDLQRITAALRDAQGREGREQAERGGRRGDEEHGRSGRGGERSGGHGRHGPPPERQSGRGGDGDRSRGRISGQSREPQPRLRGRSRGGQMSQEDIMRAREEVAQEQEEQWRYRQSQRYFGGGCDDRCPDCGGCH